MVPESGWIPGATISLRWILDGVHHVPVAAIALRPAAVAAAFQGVFLDSANGIRFPRRCSRGRRGT